jgi:hypothetical protein
LFSLFLFLDSYSMRRVLFFAQILVLRTRQKTKRRRLYDAGAAFMP